MCLKAKTSRWFRIGNQIRDNFRAFQELSAADVLLQSALSKDREGPYAKYWDTEKNVDILQSKFSIGILKINFYFYYSH